ncbi:uncharacterized protein G2W53_027089 [Senna tora]|uniref:Uncharacterized protein n=1 Tax=Senna tora TaxID=362788 RepID=A0A834TIB7_9FABA|nr:uncharacterized protein G2W53_027089 [Senna tora]
MTQGSLRRSFKVIRVGRPAVDDVDRRPSKINESWVNTFSMQNLTCICSDEMIPTTQGCLPRSFKAIRVVSHPYAGSNLRWTTTWIVVGRRRSKINHPWVNFFSMQNLTCICSDKMVSMTQGSLPRSFKAIRVGPPAVDQVDRRPSKINESWVNLFSMQNLTSICWVNMMSMTQGNLPRSFKAFRLARGQIFRGRRRGSPLVGDAKKSITHGKPPKKFQGDPSRSPGSLPRGSPSIKNQCVVGQLFFYGKSHVHMPGKNEAYDIRNLPRSFKAIRLAHGQIFDGERRGSPSVGDAKKPITHDKMIPMTQESLPKSFKAIRVGRPAVDHVDRHPSKINASCVNFFFYTKSQVHMLCQNEAHDIRKPPKKFEGNRACARPNLRRTTTWIAPITQVNLPKSFKAIRLARGQIFDGRRRGSSSVADAQNSTTHGKPPKKFQGDPSRLPGGRRRGSPTIKNQSVMG